MKEHLLSLTSYNIRANKKIEDIIKSINEEQSMLVQKSSFSTIKETIIHIWNAQAIWLDRLHNIPVTSWPGKDFTGNTCDAAFQLVENSKIWYDLVETLHENNLNHHVYYKTLKEEEFSNSWAQIISHVMNHGTYHRGQLVTLLRGAGVTEIPSTDLIAFYRDQV